MSRVDPISLKSISKVLLILSIFIFFQTQKSIAETKDFFPKIIFTDTFDNNYNKWGLHENKDSVCEIKDGKLKFFHRSKNTGTYFVWPADCVIAFDKYDFSMTAEAAKKSGDDRFYYGIMFGASLERKFIFGVTGWGFYGCWKIENGNWKLIEGRKFSRFVNIHNSTNVFALCKDKNKFSFFINDYLLNTVTIDNFYGKTIGVFISGPQKVEFDNIRIERSK